MQVAKPKKGYKLVKTSFGKYEEIPEEWEVINLGKIVQVKGRIGWRGYKKTDFVSEGDGAISLGAKNISKYNQLDLQDLTFVSWEKYEESPEIQVVVFVPS